MPIKTLKKYLNPEQLKTALEKSKRKPIQEEPSYEILGFYKETRFQETPVGKIPKDWSLKKIGDLFTESKKMIEIKTESTDNVVLSITRKGLVPRALKFKKKEVKVKSNKYKLVKPGWLVYGFPINEGVIGVWTGDKDGAVSPVYPVWIPKIVFDSKYLDYFVRFEPFVKYLSKYAPRTVERRQIIPKKYFERLEIPFPPLEEQYGIAIILSSVDRAIETTDTLIEKLERVKGALMQELLTRGIRHGEYKETPIGKIPKEWQVVKIRELAVFMKRGKTPKYGDSDVIVIKTAHNYPDRIRFEEAPRASLSFIEKLPHEYYLKPGDILINSTGTGSVGRVGFFNGYAQPCTVDGHITILRINPNVALPEFVFYYLSSPMGFKALESRAIGSTNQIELYVSAIGSLQIPLPPLEEQKRIVGILSIVDNWVNQEKKFKDKLERLKRGLMELLLTGRVRVRVASVSSG